MMNNPFRYGTIVDDPYFYGRHKELEEITTSVKNGANLILYSPRRYGKTSLVLKILKSLKQEGYNTIYIDFFKVTSRDKFIELYSREIFNLHSSFEKGILRLKELIRGIRPVIGWSNAGKPELSIRIDPALAAEAFEDVLNTPVRTEGKSWIVVFDEFQEIERLNGESFEKELRAVIQHHQQVGYIFMGSQKHMLVNMFSRKNRAFYNFGKLYQLQKPDPTDATTYLNDRFAISDFEPSKDLLGKIIITSRNIPFYLQYLASEIWEMMALQVTLTDNLFEQAIQRLLLNQNDYFLGIWMQLTPYQRKTITAIAANETGSYDKKFLQEYNLYPVSSLQKALKSLTNQDILEKENTRYRLNDPFFELWIKRNNEQ